MKLLGWVFLFFVICSWITSLLHYNNVLCILDVCLFIVDCVLVGLDWVFTHDVFKFCTSHVHAYVFSFLFFSLLSGCDVFSLSLSLSLSQINCAMAPKARKSTPTRNPLGSGSSSFDPIPPFHVWFRDEKARKDFLENFQKHGVHPECRVI